METQKRFSILNYLVVLFAFGSLFSCEQLAPVEEPVTVLEEFQDLSGIALEPEEDPINGRLIYSSDCETDCIEPGSGNYFAIRDSKSQSSGINTKKVSYKAYNTEDKFVVKVKYEITSGPSNAKASITIQIKGKKKEFKSVPSGYTATFSIPLEKGWEKCDEMTFSIVQKGLGSPISFSEDYGLIPVCEDEYTFTDHRDGQVYKIVRIGNQVWFAENLNYVMEESWCWGDIPDYCERYGRLYRWESANNACPQGWRLPTVYDWYQLRDFLGGEDLAGGKLKSVNGWYPPNIGATNETGFSALPAGLRDNRDGGFYNIYSYSDFWSSTLDGVSDEGDRLNNYAGLSFDNSKLFINSIPTDFLSLPCRCIKE
ncbi:fibrobacter succinogenes major paralogous domain-containing protein [Cognataquiflexum aquatile]|uniref:fibrobacter succinogenes major paralogous domain-containing protein n=1 Tax=Cognataquiflexum aquatile TaxID=2249427 RepID=UPI0013009BEA|nr:fibrobacter succinogenes major paralogous domain-containing protein [Cognataquiflexum aquatile]